MIVVAKSTQATLANAALSLWIQSTVTGSLIDIFSAAIQILDEDGAEVLAKTALTVSGPQHLGLGHYAFAWDPGISTPGQYTVRWFYKILSTDTEASFDQEMELVDRPYIGPSYCTVYDLRSEGLPSSITADKAQKMITRASMYIENFTGRKFGVHRKILELDGSQARALLLNEPVIATEKILLTVVSPFGSSDLTVQNDTLKVYNRHIRMGLTDPDDRMNPKLEFVHADDLNGVNYDYRTQTGYVLSALMWPRGRHNVQVTGLFGYTEADGSFTGKVPELVREAVKLMVFKLMQPMIKRTGGSPAGGILQESTKDQSVTFQAAWGSIQGGFTGDWAIDQLILMFVRPPQLGAA